MLRASMERQGIQVPFTEICGDDKEILKKQLKKALDVADIVITTGGVSVGKKDLLPEVLEVSFMAHPDRNRPAATLVARVKATIFFN